MASWAPISGCASPHDLPVLDEAPPGPGSPPGPVLRFLPQFVDERTRTVWACLAPERFTPDIVGEHAIATPAPGDVHCTLRWPTWGHLVPSGVGSLEAAEAQARLRGVLWSHGHGETRAALAAAQTALAPRRIEVTIPSQLDFWEIARRHCGEEAVLFEAEGQFDIAAASWPSLLGDPRFRSAVAIPTVVSYLHGFVGLVWWQAVQALRAGTVPRCCAGCGRPLPVTATARRRFCRKEEHPACRRARHAQRMRERRKRARAV